MRLGSVAGRCNYCPRPCVVAFRWQSSYSSRGHRRVIAITARACADHEGCVNWNALRELHPDAPLIRLQGSGPTGTDGAVAPPFGDQPADASAASVAGGRGKGGRG